MAKSIRSKHILIFIGLLSGLLAACMMTSGIPTQESEPTPEMITPPSTQDEYSLPAPLFYLQTGQIWRLDADAQSKTQITQENTPIDAFDSSTDGMLVYISNNSLMICDAEGHNRQIVRAGSALTPKVDELARLNDIEYITSAIRTPHWSPDGQQIAFIENGLQIVDLETNQTELIWSQSSTSSEPYLFESVLGWSPDGQYLLVSQYLYLIEGLHQRWLSLLQLDGPLYPKVSGSVGETFAWSPDMSDLFLANAVIGSDRSLMRCDPETMQCRLIAEFEPARWYYFYANPFVSADERLLVFMGASDDPDLLPEAFNLISLRLDGYERRNLRSDGYIIDSALWSPDGDGVIITLAQDADQYPAGSMLWLSISDVPAIRLPTVDGSNLRWGNRSN